MNFWLRTLIVMLILVGLGIVALLNADFLNFANQFFNNDKATISAIEQPITPSKKTDFITPTAKKLTKKKVNHIYSKNAAAAGLSKFYASINPDSNKKGPKIRRGVVYLPEPKGKIEKRLKIRRKVTRPLPKTWDGQQKSQSFRKGQTLYQKLYEYANDEGLDLMWELNRDLVVGDPFRINKSILRLSSQIGRALNGHFSGGVFTYFCNKERTIVLIEYPNKYMEHHCIKLTR